MKIAIFGKARSGKTEACAFLKDLLKNADVIEFSEPLKECVDILYPDERKGKNRKKLILVGQHMRKLDKDVWVNIAKHRIINSKKGNVIVTGVRQKNEYEMLKENGFIFIKVDCDEKTRIKRCIEAGDKFSKEMLNDNTETEMDEFEFDYLINNSKTKDCFYKDLKKVAVEIVLKTINNYFLKTLVNRRGI